MAKKDAAIADGAAESSGRRRRANGDASRRRILDAAAEIAGERGYEGTSINLVSERSGLPASSIYWHFQDKDELIAAVIERSFGDWLHELGRRAELPPETPRDDFVHLAMARTGRALLAAPDFLRLGLMLILERRPDELTARTRFLEVRATARHQTTALYATLFPELDPAGHDALATLTVAGADGLFIAHELDGVDLGATFDLLAAGILGAAARLRTRLDATRQGQS
jgi:AcrR family transcriptional regulator